MPITKLNTASFLHDSVQTRRKYGPDDTLVLSKIKLNRLTAMWFAWKKTGTGYNLPMRNVARRFSMHVAGSCSRSSAKLRHTAQPIG